MPTIYDTITARIVTAIEAGADKWIMPWHRQGAGNAMPINASTGNGYQGANVLVLWAEQQAHGYTGATWATYKQWQALGAQVRKGERGTATEGYYSTTLHELTHWTSHASRCNRSLRGRFGDEAYAAEELIAELGAAFLCARLGIENEPRADHAAYLATWLKVLKNDSRAIFTAASQAQKACDFLLNRLPAPVAQPQPMALAA